MSQNHPQGFPRMPQGSFFSQDTGEQNTFGLESTIIPNYEESKWSVNRSEFFNQSWSKTANQPNYIQPTKSFNVVSEIFASPPGIIPNRNIPDDPEPNPNNASSLFSNNSSTANRFNKPLNSGPLFQYNPQVENEVQLNDPFANNPWQQQSPSLETTYSSANSIDRSGGSFIVQKNNNSSNQLLQPQIHAQYTTPTPNIQQFKQFPKPQPSMFKDNRMPSADDYYDDQPIPRRISDGNKRFPNIDPATFDGSQKLPKNTTNKSKTSDQIDEMIEAISTSTHGASKFLHELCDQLKKEKPVTDYDSKLVDKQPVFIAHSKLEGFSGRGEGKSKQDAKNIASLGVLRHIVESDSFAESSLRLIISKDKSIKLMNRSQTQSNVSNMKTEDTFSKDNQTRQQQQQQWPIPQMQIQPQQFLLPQPQQFMQPQPQQFMQPWQQQYILQQQQQKGLVRTWPLEDDKVEQDFKNSDSILQRSYEPADDPYEPQNRIRSTSLRDPTKIPQPSENTTFDDTSQDFDSLAVLNELSHDNKITPKWLDKPTNDGFMAELIFDTLPKFVGHGKKKKDSHREAATKLFQYIQKSPELHERYLHKYQKRKLSKGGSHISAFETKSTEPTVEITSISMSSIQISEPKKGLLDEWIAPGIFSELKTYLETMGGMNYKDKIDSYLIDKLKAMSVNSNEQIALEAYCDFVTKVVEKVTAGDVLSKPTLSADVPKLLNSTCLFPLGSYALRHIRRDHLIADFSLVFELKEEVLTRVDDRLILEWLCGQLKSNISAIQASGSSKFNSDIKLESPEYGYDNRSCYILLKDKNSGIGVRIFASEKSELSPGSGAFEHQEIIIHIAKMNQILKKIEGSREYYDMCSALMKYWRRRSQNEALLRPEIIDILAFDLAANYDIRSPGLGIYHLLQTLANKDITVQILSRYNDFLTSYFKQLKPEVFSRLQNQCVDSLKKLYDGRYSQANF